MWYNKSHSVEQFDLRKEILPLSVLEAIIQGFVGGAGEFLPISGSGHLSVLRDLFNMPGGEGHMLLDAMIHIGAVLALLFMYWSDMKLMLGETSDLLHGRAADKRSAGKRSGSGVRLLLLILTATLPLALVLPVESYVLLLTKEAAFVGFAIVLTGCILAVYPKFTAQGKNGDNLLFKDALIIGLCQLVSVLPGISRVAAVMTASASVGSERSFSVKFAMLSGIPVLLGAAIYEIVIAASAGIDPACIPAYILGMVFSMIAGVFSISTMKLLSKKSGFGGIAYYCLIVGVLTVILSMIF